MISSVLCNIHMHCGRIFDLISFKFRLQFGTPRFAAEHWPLLVLLHRDVRPLQGILLVHVPNERASSIPGPFDAEILQGASVLGHSLDSPECYFSELPMHRGCGLLLGALSDVEACAQM